MNVEKSIGRRFCLLMIDILSVAVILSMFLLFNKALQVNFFFLENNWEGLEMLGALRFLDGLTLYPDPAEGYYYPYSPLPPIIHAAALHVLGVSPLALKLVVFVAFLTTLFASAAGMRLITGNWRPGLWGAACTAAASVSFRLWFLSVRPDNLATAFVTLGFLALIFTVKYNKLILPPIIALLLLTAAALCKTNYLLISLLIGAWIISERGLRIGIISSLPALFLLSVFFYRFNTGNEYLISTLLLNMTTQGMEWGNILRKLEYGSRLVLLGGFSFGILSAVLVNSATARMWIYRILASASIVFAATFPAVQKTGGTTNSLLPMSPLLGWLAAMALWEGASGHLAGRGGAKSIRTVWATGLFLIIIFLNASLLATGAIHAKKFATYKYSTQHLHEALHYLRSHPEKRVAIPEYEYLLPWAGHAFTPSSLLVVDLRVSNFPVPQYLQNNIKNREYDIIIGTFNFTPMLEELQNKYYKKSVAPTGYPALESMGFYTPRK